MLARLAVQVLCSYWGLASEYSGTLKEFIQRVDWDTEDDVRIMAISCCGSIVARKEHADLLGLLYRIVRLSPAGSASRKQMAASPLPHRESPRTCVPSST